MRFSLNRALAAVCGAILVLGPGTALAQQAPGQLSQGVGMRKETPRADVDFPGGTVAEYLATLDKAFGAANVAMEPGVESARIAPVRFVGVQRQDALLALQTLADVGPMRKLDVFSVNDDSIMGLRVSGRVVNYPIETRVWSLRPYLDSQTTSVDILSAIETAIGLVPGEPQIKFHKDTGLLIMRAQVDQLDAANQVLKALESAQHEAIDTAARKANADEAIKKAATPN